MQQQMYVLSAKSCPYETEIPPACHVPNSWIATFLNTFYQKFLFNINLNLWYYVNLCSNKFLICRELSFESFDRISVVEYDTYLFFYFITSINTTSWAASDLERRDQNQRNLPERPSSFCVFAFP